MGPHMSDHVGNSFSQAMSACACVRFGELWDGHMPRSNVSAIRCLRHSNSHNGQKLTYIQTNLSLKSLSKSLGIKSWQVLMCFGASVATGQLSKWKYLWSHWIYILYSGMTWRLGKTVWHPLGDGDTQHVSWKNMLWKDPQTSGSCCAGASAKIAISTRCGTFAPVLVPLPNHQSLFNNSLSAELTIRSCTMLFPTRCTYLVVNAVLVAPTFIPTASRTGRDRYNVMQWSDQNAQRIEEGIVCVFQWQTLDWTQGVFVAQLHRHRCGWKANRGGWAEIKIIITYNL